MSKDLELEKIAEGIEPKRKPISRGVPDDTMSVENFKLLLKKLLINIEAQRGKLKNG
jgi:hypothetical protein